MANSMQGGFLRDDTGALVLSAGSGGGLILPWAPATAYVAGQPVIDPSGNLQVRISNGTSGGSFDSSNWTPAHDAALADEIAARIAADGAHVAAADPHGDRAYANALLAGFSPTLNVFQAIGGRYCPASVGKYY